MRISNISKYDNEHSPISLMQIKIEIAFLEDNLTCVRLI